MNKVVLVGQGGSGKDYLAEYLSKNGFTKNIAYTTRPQRANEIDGVNYFFINSGEFEQKIQENYWHEYNTFLISKRKFGFLNPIITYFIPEKRWYYGSSRKQFNECDLFIKEVNGVSSLSKNERKQCLVVYVNIDEDIRRKRLSSRQDADNTERRLAADKSDFENFEDFDIMITNPFFDCETIKKIILSEMERCYDDEGYFI